ncbi:hypothetical protein BKI52_25975 [marine bacterium AO1-C]|nr:hypothetical protein BKI52_25975 [marine bacterium AO1-C]
MIKLSKLQHYWWFLYLCIFASCTSHSLLFIKKPLDFEALAQQHTNSAIAPDSAFIIFAYNNTTDPNDSDLFIAYRQSDKTWGTPKRLAISFEKTDDISPAISRDGKRLYFSSNRINGYGGYDIWVARLDSTGKAYATRNLGAKINTPKDEKYPFISSQRKLYFSSNGHQSKGKLDLFEATRKNRKINVKNLGNTFNSAANEFGLVYLTDTSGYYYSDRKGKLDTVHFVNKTPRFRYFLTIKIVIEDTTTQRDIPLPNSTVDIYEGTFLNKKFLQRFTTDAQGLVRNFPVNPQKEYTIKAGNNVSNIKYLTTEEEYTMTGREADPDDPRYDQTISDIHLEVSIYLKPLLIDTLVMAPIIYYDFKRWDIRPDAAKELDKSVLTFLKNNPTVIVELSYHTDLNNYNFHLSHKRSKSAVDYLISKGVKANRIKVKKCSKTDFKNQHIPSKVTYHKNRCTTIKIIGLTDE